jgi:hypothetical protein
MWSHYADKHKGICLGFDVSDETTRPVEYVKEPEMVGAMSTLHNERFDLGKSEVVANKLLGTKYDGWSYEKEIRVHVTREEKDDSCGQYFSDFNPQCLLREIILGSRCQTEINEIENALKDYPDRSAIKIIKARASSTSFKVVTRIS